MESLLFSSTLRLKVVGIFFLIQNSCQTQKSLRYKQVSFRSGFFSAKKIYVRKFASTENNEDRKKSFLHQKKGNMN
jgi:hypothetical protein